MAKRGRAVRATHRCCRGFGATWVGTARRPEARLTSACPIIRPGAGPTVDRGAGPWPGTTSLTSFLAAGCRLPVEPGTGARLKLGRDLAWGTRLASGANALVRRAGVATSEPETASGPGVGRGKGVVAKTDVGGQKTEGTVVRTVEADRLLTAPTGPAATAAAVALAPMGTSRTPIAGGTTSAATEVPLLAPTCPAVCVPVEPPEMRGALETRGTLETRGSTAMAGPIAAAGSLAVIGHLMTTGTLSPAATGSADLASAVTNGRIPVVATGAAALAIDVAEPAKASAAAKPDAPEDVPMRAGLVAPKRARAPAAVTRVDISPATARARFTAGGRGRLGPKGTAMLKGKTDLDSLRRVAGVTTGPTGPEARPIPGRWRPDFLVPDELAGETSFVEEASLAQEGLRSNIRDSAERGLGMARGSAPASRASSDRAAIATNAPSSGALAVLRNVAPRSGARRTARLPSGVPRSAAGPRMAGLRAASELAGGARCWTVPRGNHGKPVVCAGAKLVAGRSAAIRKDRRNGTGPKERETVAGLVIPE